MDVSRKGSRGEGAMCKSLLPLLALTPGLSRLRSVNPFAYPTSLSYRALIGVI